MPVVQVGAGQRPVGAGADQYLYFLGYWEPEIGPDERPAPGDGQFTYYLLADPLPGRTTESILAFSAMPTLMAFTKGCRTVLGRSLATEVMRLPVEQLQERPEAVRVLLDPDLAEFEALLRTHTLAERPLPDLG